MCLVLGEVRKGKVDLCWAGQQHGLGKKQSRCKTDLGIRRTFLQVIALVFATSLLGVEHICDCGLVMWSYGASRTVW